jgi:hypothetical protein
VLESDTDVLEPEVDITGKEIYVLPNGESFIDLQSKVQTNQPARLAVTSMPRHGTLTDLGKGMLQYSPTTGYVRGRDGFEVTVYSTAGLSYYHQSQFVAYQQQSNAIVTSQENMSYEILPGSKEHSFDYTVHNVGVQAGLLHTLSQRGLIHHVGVIIQYQHGLSHVAENEVYNNATSNYLNYQLLYRVEYKVSSKINFFVQPTFTHSLISNESLQVPFRIKQPRQGSAWE